MKTHFHQINSGFLKGKKLKIPSSETTRSTKNIVREALFNSLRYELNACLFIEAFGGSGIIASEAVSNGAKQALAIEKDKKAFQILQDNFKNLSPSLSAIYGDTFLLLPDILKNLKEEAILYLDPPFDIREGYQEIYKDLVQLLNNADLSKLKFIIFEHNSQVKIQDEIKNFKLSKSKKFGNTTLTYFQNLEF